MKRPQMNDLKQKIKEFIVWFVEDQGLADKQIEKCSMTFISYFKTRMRTDVDNYTPKFFMDGLVSSGFIVSDDYLHVESLLLKCGYDKSHPRTEIYVYY